MGYFVYCSIARIRLLVPSSGELVTYIAYLFVDLAWLMIFKSKWWKFVAVNRRGKTFSRAY